MLKLPNKVLLNGEDCFHLMLERNIIKYKTGNNIIRMVMTVKDEASLQRIETVIQTSPLIHWIANIQLKTPFFINPYWKYVNHGKTIEINFLNGDYNDVPKEILDQNFQLKKDQLIRFDSYTTANGELKLVMSFHHVLLDGRGSGLIIRHLTGNLSVNEDTINDIFPKRIKKINFFSHFINMFQVKAFVEKTMKKPIGHVKKGVSKNNEFVLRTINFDAEQTHTIDKNAKENGARFGTNLFQIACSAHAIASLIDYQYDLWVPIPYDGRKRGSFGPVISNNISFNFYRLKISSTTSISETITSIQGQMNEQLKMEMPRKYNQLLQFMKFIPKRFYYWMTTRAGKGEIASFLYSSSGESFWDTSRFSNELTDTLLIPPFTYPPGISITFLRYDGKLKMNIAVSTDKIDLKNLSLLENKLSDLLLQSCSVETN